VRVQVASEFMRRGMEQNGCPEGRIDVVAPASPPPAAPRAEEPGLILAASRLVPSKGAGLLLQALSLMVRADAQLVIAGDGPCRARLEKMAESAGLSPRVRFLGELPPEELDGWYARAAVVACPLLHPEAFGLVGIEAMAHGKPVVAFAGGATEEWLQDGRTGLVVRERRAEALAQALERLIRDSALRATLGQGARAAWPPFSPDAFVRRLVASFDRCVAGHKAAPR
jgi:glycosyltransferase involved in cell wall biosynthesis